MSRLAALVLCVSVVLGACGGGDEGEEDAAPTGSSSTTTTTAPPAASPGCDGAPVDAGREKVTITSGGRERWFFRYAVDAPAPRPLVVDFHGYSEGAEIHTGFTQLGDFGQEHGFHVVYPHGEGDPVRWDASAASDDVRFTRDLLDTVEAELCVDTDRVFVVGLSNGAMMASRLACELADRVAAIGAVAGIADPEGCEPTRRVPVLAVHGTADAFVPYDGGLGERALDLPAPDGSGRTLRELPELARAASRPPVPEIVAAWAERNGCGDEAREVELTEDVDVVVRSCPGGADVVLYRVDGGGHTWPGSPFGEAIADVVGVTTTSISTNELLWQFFEAHPRRAGG